MVMPSARTRTSGNIGHLKYILLIITTAATWAFKIMTTEAFGILSSRTTPNYDHPKGFIVVSSPSAIRRRRLPKTFLKSSNDNEEENNNNNNNNNNTEERLLNELIELTQSFEDVQRQISTSAELYQETIDSYESRTKDLESEIQTSQNVLKEKEELIQKLTREYESNTLKNEATWKGRLDEREGQLVKIRKEVEDLNKEKKSKEDQLSTMQRKEKEMMKLRVQITALEKRMSVVSKELKKKDDLIQQKDNMVEQFQIDMENARQEEMDAFKKELLSPIFFGKNDESITELQSEIEDLNDQVSSVKKRFKKKESELQSLTLSSMDERNQFDRDRSKWRKERESLTGEIVDVKSMLAMERDKNRMEMEVAVDGMRVRMEEMERKIETYEMERKSFRKLTVLGLKRIGSVLGIKKE